jgi:hypothetical protein
MVITPDIFNKPIYDSNNFELKIKLFGIGANIKNSLHLTFLRFLKNKFIRSLKKDLLKHSRAITLLKMEIEKVPTTFSNEMYIKFEKIITGYLKIYSKLNKSHFFSTIELKVIVDKTIKDLYSIEFIMKQSAFDNESHINNDTELIIYSSKVSLKTASEYEFKQV